MEQGHWLELHEVVWMIFLMEVINFKIEIIKKLMGKLKVANMEGNFIYIVHKS